MLNGGCESRAGAGRRLRRLLVLLGLAVLLVGGLSAVWRARGPSPSRRADLTVQSIGTAQWQPPSTDAYVGSRACRECHARIAESFMSHPMAQSISRIDPAAAPDDPLWRTAEVPGRRRTLWVETREGRLVHHERMLDKAGVEIYDQPVEMQYIVGSGRRARAFLHEREGLLFMSPLNWYAQAQKWDLTPGYVPDDARRFDRRVTDECLSCHAGRVAVPGRSLNIYREPAFDEMAIGCENCHGPGRDHVALHRSDAAATSPDDSIINPARLDVERRESVCNQCHLQAAARIPRSGRSDLDFRPGSRLEDIWTVFDEGSGAADVGRTRAVSHVQQMRESRCYLASEGRLGCTSCHDPHRAPGAGERGTFYRRKCLACHDESSCSAPKSERLEREDSCIACHMPARAASNVSHVSQTDHRVARTAAGAGRPGTHESGMLSFFDRADLRLEDWERERALGLAIWKRQSKTGAAPPGEVISLLEQALGPAPEDGPVLIAIGSIAATNGLTAMARESFERARGIPSSEEPALSGLLDILYLASDWERALECADRLVEIDPGDARTHALRAQVLTALGRTTEGIAAGRRALGLNPTLLPVRQWLADTLRAAGRLDEAGEEERIMNRMQGSAP